MYADVFLVNVSCVFVSTTVNFRAGSSTSIEQDNCVLYVALFYTQLISEYKLCVIEINQIFQNPIKTVI